MRRRLAHTAAGLEAFEALERRLAGLPPRPSAAAVHQKAAAAGLALPVPPAEGECCNSACPRCVWDDYRADMAALESRLGLTPAQRAVRVVDDPKGEPERWPYSWLARHVSALTLTERRALGDGTTLLRLAGAGAYELGDNVALFVPSSDATVASAAAAVGLPLDARVSFAVDGPVAQGDDLLPVAPRVGVLEDVLRFGLELEDGVAAPGGDLAALAAAAGPLLARRFTIASSPLFAADGEVDLVVTDGPGRAARFLGAAREGDVMYGAVRPSTLPPLPRGGGGGVVVMVATGSGVAPFRGFVQHARFLREAPELHLVLGVRDRVLFEQELQAALDEGALASLTVARGRLGERVQDAVPAHLLAAVAADEADLYICGNRDVTAAVAALVPGGMENERVKVEEWVRS